MTIKTYREWSPTQFDTRGLGLDERQDWLVAPVIQTRDSGVLDQSNFRSVLKELGGEGETVEVHRFGHWGPGWFEIILCAPEHRVALEEIQAALESYPVFCDDDHSALEFEAESEAWESWVRSDFERAIERDFECELDWTDDECFDLFRKACDRSNAYWEHTDEGAYIDVERVAIPVTWEDIEAHATVNESE